MKNCKCGHSQEDHIYHEGACRPGFECRCQKFDAEISGSSDENEEVEITFKMTRHEFGVIENILEQHTDDLDSEDIDELQTIGLVGSFVRRIHEVLHYIKPA